MTAPFVPMTKEDVAAVLMCTPRTIETLMKSGGIPTPTLLAGRVFWHPDVFYSWLDSELRNSTREHVEARPDVPMTVKKSLKSGNDVKPANQGNSPGLRMKAAQAARSALLSQ